MSFFVTARPWFINISLTQIFGFRLFIETSSGISHIGVFINMPMVAIFSSIPPKGGWVGTTTFLNFICAPRPPCILTGRLSVLVSGPLTRPSDTSIRARKKMHPSVIHFVVCIAVFYLWVFFHVILRFSYVLYSTFSVRRNCGRAPYPRRTMALVCLEGRRF